MAILPKEEALNEAIGAVGMDYTEGVEAVINKVYDSVGKCKDCLHDNTFDCPLEWMYDGHETKMEKPEEYPDNYYCAEFERRTDGA